MLSVAALLIIAALQLTPIGMQGYLSTTAFDNFESIVDKITVIIAMLMLYFKGDFANGYIKAIILMQVVILWLLLINKIGEVFFTNKALLVMV